MKEKYSYIEKLIKSVREYEEPNIFLINAIFNTINTSSLVQDFLIRPNDKIKGMVYNHLIKRLKSESLLNKKKIFYQLLKINESSTYHTKLRIRLLLLILVESMPIKEVRIFFDLYSASSYLNDLSAAINVSHKIWNHASDEKFLKAYLKTGNYRFLGAYIQNGKPDSILPYIKKIWKIDLINDREKTSIIRKVSPTNFKVFSFLKSTEPDKYLYAAAFSNTSLDDSEIEILYNKLDDSQKVFGLWCCGKMNKWNFLKYKLKNYIR